MGSRIGSLWGNMPRVDESRVIDGRFVVEGLLGAGAHARTHRCTDDRGRAVAVKELRVRGLDGWKPLYLFQREAKVLAQLRHHGVPEVLGTFEGRDERGDVAMYLVQ